MIQEDAEQVGRFKIHGLMRKPSLTIEQPDPYTNGRLTPTQTKKKIYVEPEASLALRPKAVTNLLHYTFF